MGKTDNSNNQTPDAKKQRADSFLDLWAGLFFSVVACVGWYSHLSNGRLAEAFIMGGDPGPSFFPKITLWMITLGGIGYILKGSRRISDIRLDIVLHEIFKYKAAFLFVISLVLLVMFVPVFGFSITAFLFAFIWLLWLSLNASLPKNAAIIFAAVTSVAICVFLYVVFFYLLNINMK